MLRLVAETVLHTALFPGTILVVLPGWLLASEGRLAWPSLSPASAAGIVAIAVGFGLGAWCTWDFVAKGKGTPNPLDPPKLVVATGPYRHVRNPMYVSVATMLVGEALVFASVRLVAYTAVVVVGFHLFVLLYEEPTLRRLFGSSYDAYCTDVPRWLPRLSPRA